MKHLLLVSIMAASIGAYSSTKAHSMQESITGCDRYNGISESLYKECNPEAIKELMKKRDVPFEEKLTKEQADPATITIDKNTTCKLTNDIEHPGMTLTSLAAKKFCPDALSMISKKVSAKDYAEGISDGFAEEYLNLATKLTEDEKEEKGAAKNKEAMNKAALMAQTMKVVATRIIEDCKKNIKESCETQKELKKLGEKLEAAAAEDCKNGNKASCPDTQEDEQKKNEEYLSSAEYIVDQACPAKFELERYEAMLKNEKEVGKVSGAVNVQTLRNAGAMIVMTRSKLTELKKAYLKKTKHNINLKDCKKSDYFEGQ